jgi:hypothetical protein
VDTWTPPAGDLPADRLRGLFLTSFSVMDVAEPLASFDAEKPAADVRAFLESRGWSLAGTRFASKRQADDAFQRIQALRNALAHAQSSIASSDWKLVVQLAHSVDSLSVVL